MSTRALSPSANLLRTSRLFSLPAPLPRPINELGNAPNSGSSTATLPYPVQATIETSEKALARGDWGLKRPLPLKSTTKTSAPCVNIDNIDSIDHITDFRSASAYARTLEKWQETDLSISTYTLEDNRSLESVFEPDIDNTVRQQSGSTPNERWKFEGPWLGAQTDREFLAYFSKRVKGRRSEFRQYLRRNLPKEKRAQQRRHLREQGEPEEDALTLETATKPMSEDQLDIEMKKLRAQPGRLEALVRRFLDLPTEQKDVSTNDVLQPPSTHPSAGLSYQRSHSHTFNHPVHGPQVYKAPIRARVLLPQRDSRGKERRQAVLGVGGVVCNDGELPFWNDSKDNRVAKLDPDTPGGAKTWVGLRKAMVDPEGRIQLVTARADGNILGPSSISETETYAKKTTKGALSANGSSDSYGLEELSQPRRNSRVAPFKGRNQLLQTISNSLSGVKHNLKSVSPQLVRLLETKDDLDSLPRLVEVALKTETSEQKAWHTSPFLHSHYNPDTVSFVINKMGRVRTKTVKKSAKVIIERYYPKLTLDFETNKRICDEIAIIASKRLRNKIAGYTTHLMKRIQRGPVRGISFKLQEEERERKDQYVPEISALDFANQEGGSGQLDVDSETKDMLKSLGFDSVPVNVVAVAQQQIAERPRRFEGRPPRPS